eukprot:Phypoly_transcript_17615.p1 GENE.Phypoly_transcript_17615~~Phypoly_transcript_17615.p1  ORF type:complete len:192 (+),score=29.83 Phypoly_transcript_17615:177-752(+)
MAKLDDFSQSQQFLISVGKEKGEMIDRLIKDANPKTALELGAFVGYSAVRTARLLPEGAMLLSIEKSPLHAAIATKIVEFAGLQPKVKILVGGAADVIPKLRAKYGVEKLDYVFLDHAMELFKQDLKVIEENNLLKKGTVLVADNVVIPGAPDYLEYVRTSPKYKSSFSAFDVEAMDGLADGMEVSVVVQE